MDSICLLVLYSFADVARSVLLPAGAAVGERRALLQRSLPARMVVSDQWPVKCGRTALSCSGHAHFQPDLRPQSVGSLPPSVRHHQPPSSRMSRDFKPRQSRYQITVIYARKCKYLPNEWNIYCVCGNKCACDRVCSVLWLSKICWLNISIAKNFRTRKYTAIPTYFDWLRLSSYENWSN